MCNGDCATCKNSQECDDSDGYQRQSEIEQSKAIADYYEHREE